MLKVKSLLGALQPIKYLTRRSTGMALVLTHAGVGAHHQHGEVGAVACEAKDGGLQVLVVSSQVNESDHLGGALTDLLCRP